MPDNVQDTLDKGREANRELPIVTERVEEFKAAIMEKLAGPKTKTDQEIRNLCQALQIADMVVGYLTLNKQEAKHANNKIDEIQNVGKKPTLLQRAFRP